MPEYNNPLLLCCVTLFSRWSSCRFRVGTGQGGYGHGLDRVFQGLNSVALVAVADADQVGLRHGGERLGVSHLYDDCNRMLAREKPDLGSIAPSWVSERVPMIEAAVAAGAISIAKNRWLAV